MDLSFLEDSYKIGGTGGEQYWRHVYRRDLEPAIIAFSRRGLIHSGKWLAELLFTLRDVTYEDDTLENTGDIKHQTEPVEDPCYYMCKFYFDLREYDRCSYYAENINTPCVRFLRFYAQYMSLEKKRVEDMTEPTCALNAAQTKKLGELRRLLSSARGQDPYLAYLYGVVCKKLDLKTQAIDAFCEAVRGQPLLWAAWKELTGIIDDVRTVRHLHLPDHWMKLFFVGNLLMEYQNNSAAIHVYLTLRSRGLQDDRYIRSQLAISYHNHRIVDKAVEEFTALHASDPFRLDNLDIYSNLLYVKDEKVELSHLAHKASEIDKYRVETCCIIGNLYSLRMEHQKAVVYFQRALRINPQYLSAWTLMGHEYMEMKNSSAAIQSYRYAIEANKRDYRAWYGLGQTYEILRMSSYSLYYYQQAHMLRPNDSRMLSAMGDIYEKLGQNNNAIRTYKMARNVGDIEGTALIKLAKLMQKLGQNELTAMLFKEFAAECETREPCDKAELCRAYKYLAGYFLQIGKLNDAYNYAHKCLAFEEAKDEAKSLLEEITLAQRNTMKEEEDDGMSVEEVKVTTPPSQNREFLFNELQLWNAPRHLPQNSPDNNDT